GKSYIPESRVGSERVVVVGVDVEIHRRAHQSLNDGDVPGLILVWGGVLRLGVWVGGFGNAGVSGGCGLLCENRRQQQSRSQEGRHGADDGAARNRQRGREE